MPSAPRSTPHPSPRPRCRCRRRPQADPYLLRRLRRHRRHHRRRRCRRCHLPRPSRPPRRRRRRHHRRRPPPPRRHRHHRPAPPPLALLPYRPPHRLPPCDHRPLPPLPCRRPRLCVRWSCRRWPLRRSPYHRSPSPSGSSKTLALPPPRPCSASRGCHARPHDRSLRARTAGKRAPRPRPPLSSRQRAAPRRHQHCRRQHQHQRRHQLRHQLRQRSCAVASRRPCSGSHGCSVHRGGRSLSGHICGR